MLFYKLLAIFLLSACAGLQTSMDKKEETAKPLPGQKSQSQKLLPPTGSSQHQEIFLAAKTKIEADKYSEAKPLLEDYLKKAPTGIHVDQTLLFLGQLSFRERQFAQAESYLNKIIFKSPPSQLINLARFYRARTWEQMGKKQEAFAELSLVDDRNGVFPESEKLKLFMFWGKMAKDFRQFRDSALAYRRAYLVAEKLKSQTMHEARIHMQALIEKDMSKEDLETFLRYADTRSVPGAMALKRFEELERASTATTDEENTLTTLSETAIMDISKVDETFGEESKIGLLFPVESAAWAKAIQDGIQLAFKKNNSRIQIVVQNPGATVSSAIQSFDRLVNEHKVMLVVGPLSGEQSQVIAKKAESSGVPFISTSPRTHMAWGATTLNFSFDFKKQAEALVKYAHENLNASRYAMIFPRDDFGRGFAEAFVDSVQKRGSSFTAIESFPVGQADFRKNVENMVGLGNLVHARWGERDALVKEYQAKVKRPLKDKERRDISLPAIVDFDVLFIPDSFKVIGQVAPLLAYYDIDGVTLMGPSTWNSPQVLQRGGQFLDESVFVDFFAKTSPNEVVREFIRSFESEYGKTPGALSALGYDMGSSIDRAMKNPTSNRKDLLKSFMGMGEFMGVLGLEKWDEKRDPLSELQIFRIKKNAINWQQSLRIR